MEKKDTLFYAEQLFSKAAFYQASNKLAADFSTTTDSPLLDVGSNDSIEKQVDQLSQDFFQYHPAQTNKQTNKHACFSAISFMFTGGQK